MRMRRFSDHPLRIFASVLVDPADLIDSAEVAALVGLSASTTVSIYRRRYADFPTPVIEKSGGKAVLWLRADVERWVASR